LAASMLAFIVLASCVSAASMNPVTGSNPLQCPEGSEPRVYLLDMAMVVHPSHFGGYEYGDYYFYMEIYQKKDGKIVDWFVEPEYDNYRLESDEIIQYNTCGARAQLVPDAKGNYQAVMHSHGAVRGKDTCNLLLISERPVDLPASTSLTYTSTAKWEDDLVLNSRKLHGAWYGLLQDNQAETLVLVPKLLPELPLTSNFPVLMCTATEEVEVVLFVENVMEDYWSWLDPREWWAELTEELYGQPMLYQAHVVLDDNPETLDQVFKVGGETSVNYEYFFSHQSKKVENTEDVFKTAAYIFVPRLPSLSIFGTAIATAIDSVWGITKAINPINWLKAMFAIAWGVLLFLVMGAFHYVKTYLFVAVTYMLWMEILYQTSISASRANVPVAALAYISGFLMVAGSFLLLIVDWTGWL